MRNSQRAVAALLGIIVALMVVAAIWVRVTAPEPLQLSGARTTRSYDQTGFDAVIVQGQWRVTIVRGDAWAVSVEVPAEIVDDVRVTREGDALRLAYVDGLLFGGFGRFDGAAAGALQATVTMPALASLDLSGTSQLTFSGFEGNALSLDVSGGVDLRGTASRFEALTLDLSGAGNIDLQDVSVTDANVDVSGAANITLRMSGGRLAGDMSGAGNLEYYGTVSQEAIDKSGIANVRHRN
jgi:hypothetical protein